MAFFDFCSPPVKNERAKDYDRKSFLSKRILGFISGAKELTPSMNWSKVEGKDEIKTKSLPSLVRDTCLDTGSPKRKIPSRAWKFSVEDVESQKILDCLNTPLPNDYLEEIQKIGSRMPEAWIKPRHATLSSFETLRKTSSSWNHSLSILDGISLLCNKLAEHASYMSIEEYKSTFSMIEYLLEESRRHLDPLARESLEQFRKTRKLLREEFIGKIEPASVRHILLTSDLFVKGGGLFSPTTIEAADLEAVKANRDFRPDRLAESQNRKRPRL